MAKLHFNNGCYMSPPILMRQKYISCTITHHISSPVCMLLLPVCVPVSTPPVIWQSVHRMLVRTTYVSGNADGTRAESISQHATPQSSTSPSCTASVHKCRSDCPTVLWRSLSFSHLASQVLSRPNNEPATNQISHMSV
jgi:hypothetical protein